MADRFAKHPAFRRTPTPLLNLSGESGSRKIKVTRDPPLRKLYFPPSEELGPAFDIPELVPPKKCLPPLGSMDSCDVDYDGDKEVVTLPRRSLSRANNREPAAKKEEKKRMVQKQKKAVRESTPDIDSLVRKLCGGSDLPPVAHFTTQPVLPCVMNKTTDKRPSLKENKCAVKMDKGDKAGRKKKDKRKKDNGEFQREGEKGMVTKKMEKKAKKAKMTIQTPPPSVVSPGLSQILKEVQDVYAAHEKNVASSASMTNSTDVFKQDPLAAYQNRVLASEDTVKGNSYSRQPWQQISPNARQPLRRTTPYPKIRKSSPEIDLDKEVTFSFDINEEEEEESLTYTQSIPFMAPSASQMYIPRKPLVSEPTRLGLLPKPPAFPKPPSTRGGAQIGFRRRRYQAGVQKKQNF